MVKIAVGTKPVGGVIVKPNQPNKPMVDNTEKLIIIRVSSMPENVRSNITMVIIITK